MRGRDRAYRIARTSGSADDLARFRLLCAEASNALNSAKNRHIAARLSDAPSAESKWRELRSIYITSSTLPSPFMTFEAATLNAHFAVVVNRHPPLIELEFEAAAARPLDPNVFGYFDLRPVTEHDVHNCSFSEFLVQPAGWDGLSMPMLKLAVPAIVATLTNPKSS